MDETTPPPPPDDPAASKQREKGMRDTRFFGIMLLCIGAFVLYDTVTYNKTQAATATWPTTPGSLYYADVYQGTIHHKHYDAKVYRQNLGYSYIVDGKQYSSNHINSIDDDGYWYTDQDARDALPAIGTAYTVHYDPAVPSRSVVKLLPMRGWYTYISSTVAIAIGIPLAFFTRRIYAFLGKGAGG